MSDHTYIAIDLKSFYASVECVDQELDPLITNLVVADETRTDKTICLAVSPALKSFGVPGRPRLFEVRQRVREINRQRECQAPRRRLTAKSAYLPELNSQPELAVDFLITPPRMARYMEVSTQIYSIYLRYFAPEDIHVYSIDEVFIDVTHYLKTYKATAHDLARIIIQEIIRETHITATAGIGTNLYLCKVALDIVAKYIPADEDGVRIAELDERSYREKLWSHRPLTDFWRVGHGYAKKLEQNGLYTMGDIARCSIGADHAYHNEDLLYDLFGVNAELLIDHAWGYEPCTMKAVKSYKPETNCLSSGQVLHCPYDYNKTRLVVREMTDLLVLDLVDKHLVTDQVVLTVGYDIENLSSGKSGYHGKVKVDRYGRKVPEHAHGTINLPCQTSSTRQIVESTMELFDRIVDEDLLVRRINITVNHLIDAGHVVKAESVEQLDLFTDYEALEREREKKQEQQDKERHLQEAVLALKKRYGKNTVLKGMNLLEGATARDRNSQIGGHKA